MSPKSLLRHKDAVSSLDELADGRFQNVIGEVEALPAKGVKRVIACSGKVYYELVAHRREHNIRDVAIIRLEQQYPFPHAEFRAALAQFPRRRKWSGARRSRRIRARGTDSWRITAPIRCRTRPWRTPGARFGVNRRRLHGEAPRTAETADRGSLRRISRWVKCSSRRR
jgi:hypothetical protein